MKHITLPIIALSVALSGCAAPKISRHVAEGTGQVQAATVSVTKARVAAERAYTQIRSGKRAVAELEATATVAQKPLVAAVRASLAEIEQENNILRVSLDEIAPKLEAAQESIDVLGSKLFAAEKAARDYRRLKLWLSLLAAAAAGYAAFRAIPPVIGPYRLWAAGGAALGAATIVWAIL